MFVGIDLGQSAVKVTALAVGTPTQTASSPYPSTSPRPGWVEQHPARWLEAMGDACRQVMAALNNSSPPWTAGVQGVCVTGATHHGVLLDKSGTVLRPVITMRDVRTIDQVQWLRSNHYDLVLARTRNVPDAAWTLPHLMWVRQNEPEVWSHVQHVIFGKDYLIRSLTGTLVTDEVEVEGSLLWNPMHQRWDPDLLALVGLTKDVFPPVVAPASLVGRVTADAAELTGLPAGTPVFAGCSDTAAEAYAAGARTTGSTVIKLATSGNVNVVTASPEPGDGWVTYTHLVEGLSYHAIGTSSAASAFDWLRTAVDPSGQLSFESLDEEASRVPKGSESALFVPYLGGARSPTWDPRRRAAFARLDASHGRGHLVRAVYEGVAYSMRECTELLRLRGYDLGTPFVIGGGARSEVWRQILADVLKTTLTYPRFPDASAGAAMLAHRGLTGSEMPLSIGEETCSVTQPREAATDSVYEEGFAAYTALVAVLSEVDHLGHSQGNG